MRGKKAKNKSKGKKSSSKDREWTHEGGTSLAADPENSQGSERPKYRVTQERDEKNRRLRFKQELLKQKKFFVKKMSRKLSFKDVLPNTSPTENNSDPSKKAKNQKPSSSAPPSAKSEIAQRLKMMVSRGMESSVPPSENEIEEDSEEAETADEHMDGPHAPSQVEAGEDFQSKGMTTDGGVRDFAVDDEESCSEEEDDARTGDCCRRFFAYDWKKIPIDRHKQSLIATVEGLEVYGSLNHEMAPLQKMRLLKDIPELPKLWRSRGNEPLSPLSATLLSYLLSYSDVLFEAVVAENEGEILRATTLHCMVHVLRAR